MAEGGPRVAVVTGGGRGIGRSIALRLAAAGADVAVAGRDPAVLADVAAAVEALGRRSLAVPADVANEEQVAHLARLTRERLGLADVLVNNAGIAGPTAPVQAVSRAQWDEVLAVNLTGAFLCCRAFLPDMIARRIGKVVNISSVAGKTGYALRAHYAASKWGMIGLTRSLALEAGPFNVQVNAICPGPVEGERLRRVIRDRARELGQPEEEVERTYVRGTALGRMVSPEDVAELVAFLASPASDNITGQAIDVSAGYAL
jgi:NAD(P)-dependent dehydrogenase (short-subunit alcohol dehydrogenase family)